MCTFLFVRRLPFRVVARHHGVASPKRAVYLLVLLPFFSLFVFFFLSFLSLLVQVLGRLNRFYILSILIIVLDQRKAANTTNTFGSLRGRRQNGELRARSVFRARVSRFSF